MAPKSSRKARARAKPRKTSNAKTSNPELGFLAKALRGLGSLGGASLGSMVGAPAAGSAFGSSLGAAVSKWMGAGDYSVSRNTIVQRASANIPMMHNSGQSVTVRHREFVGSINGSVGYTTQLSLPLNPGMSSTFPWLSAIAARFQEYEFKGLIFHYVPTSGTFNGTNAALGSVMMQTTYRTTDTAPSNKVELLNEYCSNEVVPFDTMVHPIECDPKENPFSVHYLRTGAITSGEPLMYDLGRTFVATQGMASSDQVGDLWVTYEVELKKPLISSPVVSSPAYFARTYSAPSSSSFFSGTASPQIGSLAITATGRTITIPPRSGNFFLLVEIYSVGTLSGATVSWNGTFTSDTNLTSWPWDGVHTTEGTVATSGTTAALNTLRYAIGFSLVDSNLPGTTTFPTAVWTGGSTATASITCFATGA